MRDTVQFFVLGILSLCVAFSSSSPLPVVIWHGMGASCCASGGTSVIQKLIEEKLGVYVLSISTGGSEAEQVYGGFFGNIKQQVLTSCQLIQTKAELKDGFNAVGLSQGGLFLRAVVELCQDVGPKMHTLVTLGAPHQGVINIPTCTGLPNRQRNGSSLACKAMSKFLSWGAYLPWIRDHVIQAQYFRDAADGDAYLKWNAFLPFINNEVEPRSKKQQQNLASLHKLVMFRFDGDFTVVPRDSAWFSLFSNQKLTPLRDTALYKEDYIGLRQLDEDGRLLMNSFPGAHMRFSLEEFEEEVIKPFFSNSTSRRLPTLPS